MAIPMSTASRPIGNDANPFRAGRRLNERLRAIRCRGLLPDRPPRSRATRHCRPVAARQPVGERRCPSDRRAVRRLACDCPLSRAARDHRAHQRAARPATGRGGPCALFASLAVRAARSGRAAVHAIRDGHCPDAAGDTHCGRAGASSRLAVVGRICRSRPHRRPVESAQHRPAVCARSRLAADGVPRRLRPRHRRGWRHHHRRRQHRAASRAR